MVSLVGWWIIDLASLDQFKYPIKTSSIIFILTKKDTSTRNSVKINLQNSGHNRKTSGVVSAIEVPIHTIHVQ